ncbi:MAG: DUF418 domain-containing protein [Beutenbergiaceae bacterium]
MSNTIVLEGAVRPGARVRVAGLDIARGVAILGTLWTNIWLFSHQFGMAGYLIDPVTPGTSAVAAHIQSVLMALSQGKFLALLCMLFGMGLAIQHAGAIRRGQRWPGRYLWRAVLLFLDGVLNYVLIAEFDVLMGYAVTAGLVAWMLLASEVAQRWLIAGFAAAHVVLVGAVSALAFAYSDQLDSGSWQGPNPYADGSFADLVAFRLDNLALFRAEPVLIAFGTVALFLVGASLYRAGIFTPDGGRLRRRLLVVGVLAFPVDLALGSMAGVGGVLVERYLIAPLVSIGLLALIAEICTRREAIGWMGRRLQEVGRTALSCYLLQNLVAGAIFYGWGLGLAADLGAWRVPATLAGYVAITSVVVLCAHLWLRRFRTGPVEWAWRRAGNLGR